MDAGAVSGRMLCDFSWFRAGVLRSGRAPRGCFDAVCSARNVRGFDRDTGVGDAVFVSEGERLAGVTALVLHHPGVHACATEPQTKLTHGRVQ